MDLLQFDTLDTKPKLFHLAVMAAFAGGLIFLLSLGGTARFAVAICAIMCVFCLVTLFALLHAWRGQLRYNPYSYNTIYYFGFALFDLSVLATNIILEYRMLRFPESYPAEAILSTLLNSAKLYMLISAPFILVFSAALVVSNLSLIRHEGFRPVNMLGILLSFLLVGGEIFLFTFDFYASGSRLEVMLHDLAANLFAAVYLYFECMLIGILVAGVLVTRYEPKPDKDFIIILGCGIRKDGTPSPLLRGRIDRALAFAEKQRALTGTAPRFVTSGGQGQDEPISESASMKRYLMEKGVPEARIVEEDRSASTFENMRFSKDRIDAIRPGAKVAFSTTNYHVFRSGLLARRVKMRAVGMGAKTKWYFWPNAAVREFVGMLTAHRLKQALIFGGMVLFYVVLTLLVYR